VQVWGIVLAAGSGERFGAPKQFARLGGRRLYDWAVDAVRPVCDGVVLVLPPDRAAPAVEGVTVVAGGTTRSASVRAGLGAVPDGTDVIVVHDAAHPLAGSELVRAVVAAVTEGADAGVPMLAVTETTATVTGGRVDPVTTPAAGRVLLQLPTAFRAHALRAARAEDPDADDDVALLAAAGFEVATVPGPPANVHVTTAAELEMAGHLLAARNVAGP
jgi:2-C-methyl-D-erythritol 4-phosphate cytidylyltransferase